MVLEETTGKRFGIRNKKRQYYYLSLHCLYFKGLLPKQTLTYKLIETIVWQIVYLINI